MEWEFVLYETLMNQLDGIKLRIEKDDRWKWKQ